MEATIYFQIHSVHRSIYFSMPMHVWFFAAECRCMYNSGKFECKCIIFIFTCKYMPFCLNTYVKYFYLFLWLIVPPLRFCFAWNPPFFFNSNIFNYVFIVLLFTLGSFCGAGTHLPLVLLRRPVDVPPPPLVGTHRLLCWWLPAVRILTVSPPFFTSHLAIM